MNAKAQAQLDEAEVKSCSGLNNQIERTFQKASRNAMVKKARLKMQDKSRS